LTPLNTILVPGTLPLDPTVYVRSRDNATVREEHARVLRQQELDHEVQRAARLMFRCVTFLDVLPNGVPAYTMLLLTGYRNHLVLVSADRNGRAAELPKAEKYLNGMLATLMR
jgi:hypothetical protein